MASSRAGNGSSVSRAIYGDDLRDRYVGRHVEWIESNLKEPQAPETKKDYEAKLKHTQTVICVQIASLHYWANTDVDLSGAAGIDSHWFDMKWVDPLNKTDKCFHVNFTRKVDGRERTFFAELVGPSYPGLLVRRCVEYGPQDSMHNCRFCSGLWHPMETEGGFHGKKRNLERKRRAE